ncbi:kinase-like domain-containing protein, partial [Vararia minispora EC-137]
ESEGNDLDMESDEEAMEEFSDDEEEYTLNARPEEERIEIEAQMLSLERAVPSLTNDYRLVDRLGTGTFSTVFKAVDLHHQTKWDNSLWRQSNRMSRRVFVALKRIYVTSAPDRIRNEISIMETCRGARYVSQIITAFRERDQIVLVLPYQRNDDFREFFRFLPMEGIKAYFRCLFRALRDIHARCIIHRDVKPANFLFDPRMGVGTLCDFGLACRVERASTLGLCYHTPASKLHPHGRIRSKEEMDAELIRQKQREARARTTFKSERVGYLDKDPRPHSRANRAGTRGFRAPEVLLKCGDQTGAIDVWAAGTILCFFLTNKFPLMNSGDDVEALMEIASIIGRRKMEKVATLHSRTFSTNIPSLADEGVVWSQFVEKLNPNLRIPRPPDPRFFPYCISHDHPPPPSSPSSRKTSPPSSDAFGHSPTSPSSNCNEWEHDVENALDLLEKTMHPESVKRITPLQALRHPFLLEDGVDDNDFFPHPPGGGVCANWHLIDDEEGSYFVRIRLRDGEPRLEDDDEDDEEPGTILRRISAGEGIAIGNSPCEFHSE